MKKKKRLLWQLYPSYLLITLISLTAVTWYASKSLRNFSLQRTVSDLQIRACLLDKQIVEHFSPLDEEGINLLCKEVGLRAKTRITIILPAGKVIGDSEEDPAKMDNHIDRLEVRRALRGDVGVSTRYSRTLKKEMVYVGVPLYLNDNLMGVIRASMPLVSIDEAVMSSKLKIALAGLFIALLAAIVSLLISRRIVRPIEEIRKGAERFSQGDFNYKLPVSDVGEIGSLSKTMNQMALELNDRINTIMRQRNEFEGVLSSMVEGVMAVDMEEYILNMNAAAALMFGCNPDETGNRSIQVVVRNADLHHFVTKTLSSPAPVEKEIVLASNGEKFLNAHGTQLCDADGKQIGALIVLNDVTRLRKLEKIRKEFVANVSHEIKTPITAIKGFVETLRDGVVDDPAESQRFLAIIGKHVDRLEAVIEDLLKLSRIEQEIEKREILLTEGNIKRVLRTAIQICEIKAAAKKIKIELSCDEQICSRIDSLLLEHAVVNLLVNAVKYSDEGSIVRVETLHTDDEIIISVSDQGCGIEKKHLPRLFERFYCVDKARSREMGGTGLGLAIVKHIAQAHGGHVSVESTLGKGSVFSIHLPG